MNLFKKCFSNDIPINITQISDEIDILWEKLIEGNHPHDCTYYKYYK